VSKNCIFCGASGATVKITLEHTFSNWINDVLPAAVIGPDVTCERTMAQAGQAAVIESWSTSQVASHKLRDVCATCNNGWMSLLEGEVRPLLTPMIEGYNSSLTIDQQITVATWTTMKAAVFEYVWSDDPVFSGADRETIRSQNRPPATAQVRIAAIESNGYPLRAIGRVYELADSDDRALCLTITIGCLVLQMFGGPGAGTAGLRRPARIGGNFTGIYPPQMQPVQWPPPNALDDAGLGAFADPLAHRAHS
jgi:hypothetical protein